jgi:hypothetical protein
MKQLYIFKYNLYFQSWGELYLGCKTQWIMPHDVLGFCKGGKIKPAKETDYASLYLALDDSLFQFYEQLKTMVLKTNDVPIVKNEDELSESVYDYIPSEYFKIWELEFLLKIKDAPLDDAKKLDEIAYLFDTMGYPETWKPFLYYQQQENGLLLPNDSLYQNFINYIEEQKPHFL